MPDPASRLSRLCALLTTSVYAAPGVAGSRCESSTWTWLRISSGRLASTGDSTRAKVAAGSSSTLSGGAES